MGAHLNHKLARAVCGMVQHKAHIIATLRCAAEGVPRGHHDALLSASDEVLRNAAELRLACACSGTCHRHLCSMHGLLYYAVPVMHSSRLEMMHRRTLLGCNRGAHAAAYATVSCSMRRQFAIQVNGVNEQFTCNFARQGGGCMVYLPG